MTTNPVGAAGGNEPVKPNMVTEAAVKKELAKIKEKINADPTQPKPTVEDGALKGYTKEQLEALLYDDVKNLLNVNLYTAFDEKVYNEKNLIDATYSSDVTDMRRNTDSGRQELLEQMAGVDLKKAADIWTGKVALPIDTDALDNKLSIINDNALDIKSMEGKDLFDAATEQDFSDAVLNINKTNNKLAVILASARFDDKQKADLTAGLQQAYTMTPEQLAKEFNVTVDVSKIKNMGGEKKKATPEEVAEQKQVFTDLLNSLPKDEDLKNIQDELIANMEYLFDDKSKGLVQRLATSVSESVIKGRDKNPETKENFDRLNTQFKDAQDSLIANYIKLQKAELFKDVISNYRDTIVKEMKGLLDFADTELIQSEEFDNNAEFRSGQLRVEEGNIYADAVKQVKTTGVASSNTERKLAKAAEKDHAKTEKGKNDPKIKEKVITLGSVHDEAIAAENTAQKTKREEGFKKNFAHINQFIFDCQHGVVENKEITRFEGQELRNLLGQYTVDDADKVELIADYVKLDDQSGEALSKKTKVKVALETDHEQITPKELKCILENVQDMDLALYTTEQKAEAKKFLKEYVETYKNATETLKNCTTPEQLDAWYNANKDAIVKEEQDPENPENTNTTVLNKTLFNEYKELEKVLKEAQKEDPKE